MIGKGTLAAVIFFFLVWVMHTTPATPEGPAAYTAPVACPTEDSCALDYAAGAWTLSYADGALTVPLACPTEDSCTLDYAAGRWTVSATA